MIGRSDIRSETLWICRPALAAGWGENMTEIKRVRSEAVAAGTVIGSAMERAVWKKQGRENSLSRKRAIRAALYYVLAFFVVITLLLQSVSIYATQKKLTDLNTSIYSLTRENEILKVEIIKATNLNAAKQGAKDNEFVNRSDVKGMAVDLNYNNFRAEEAQTARTTFFDNLFAMFR